MAWTNSSCWDVVGRTPRAQSILGGGNAGHNAPKIKRPQHNDPKLQVGLWMKERGIFMSSVLVWTHGWKNEVYSSEANRERVGGVSGGGGGYLGGVMTGYPEKGCHHQLAHILHRFFWCTMTRLIMDHWSWTNHPKETQPKTFTVPCQSFRRSLVRPSLWTVSDPDFFLRRRPNFRPLCLVNL